MGRIRETIAYGLCFFCSAFIGNGYSPIFSVMAEAQRRNTNLTGTLSFFGVKALNDISTGVFFFTFPHYFVYALSYVAAKWGSVVSSFTFFFVSNSVCFFQMMGTFYDCSVQGYLNCMYAGVPFFFRNIIGCLLMDFGFFAIHNLENFESRRYNYNLSFA